jgi:hypothetical protein
MIFTKSTETGNKIFDEGIETQNIVQNTEEPDSICIEDEYYEPTEDETVVDFEFLWYCNEDKLNKLIELNIDTETDTETDTDDDE